MTALTPAREVAYDAFVQVMDHGRLPDEVTEELYAALPSPLKRVDRNLVKEILYGSLRWYAKIFWILQNTSTRDLKETTPEIRAALVLGTYQIFYMDKVPDRAAVNESVEYVRKKGQANAVSFINGILRQIARRAQYFAKPDKIAKPVEYLALQFSHPAWIVERWFDHFKFDRMETLLASNNQPPPWAVRVNQMKTPFTQIHELQQQLLKTERTHSERRPLRSSLHLRQSPDLEAKSLFGQGYFTIQDEASQLIGLIVDPQPGEAVLDAACGPGGKLGHLYELCGGKARLTACERNPAQVAKAKKTMARLGHGVEGADGEKVTWIESDLMAMNAPAAFDRILLDAPCSGLGVLRRHPEGKWLKRSSLIRQMAETQRQLLEHVLTMLKPGGQLIYSVCSFEPEESLDHVPWLKDKLGDSIELLSPVSRLPDYYKRYVTRQNLLMVYAGNQDDMDGFAAFILRKVT